MTTTTSSIDEAVPADNVQVDKALIRANFSAAKDEINELLIRTRMPSQIAYGIRNLIDS